MTASAPRIPCRSACLPVSPPGSSGIPCHTRPSTRFSISQKPDTEARATRRRAVGIKGHVDVVKPSIKRGSECGRLKPGSVMPGHGARKDCGSLTRSGRSWSHSCRSKRGRGAAGSTRSARSWMPFFTSCAPAVPGVRCPTGLRPAARSTNGSDAWRTVVVGADAPCPAHGCARTPGA